MMRLHCGSSQQFFDDAARSREAGGVVRPILAGSAKPTLPANDEAGPRR